MNPVKHKGVTELYSDLLNQAWFVLTHNHTVQKFITLMESNFTLLRVSIWHISKPQVHKLTFDVQNITIHFQPCQQRLQLLTIMKSWNWCN